MAGIDGRQPMSSKTRTEELDAEDRTSDLFEREPGRPFHNRKKENFCQARAQAKPIKAAAEEAGVSERTGQTWDKEPSVRERVAELGALSQPLSDLTMDWVLGQAKEIVISAKAAGQHKAALEGLTFIRTVLKQDPEYGPRSASRAAGTASLGAGPALKLPGGSQFRRQLEKVLREGAPQTEALIEVSAEEAEEDDEDDDDA